MSKSRAAQIKGLEEQVANLQRRIEKLREPVTPPEPPKTEQRREAFEMMMRGAVAADLEARGWSRNTVRDAVNAAVSIKTNAAWVMDFSAQKDAIPSNQRLNFQRAHVFMWKNFPERMQAHLPSRSGVTVTQ